MKKLNFLNVLIFLLVMSFVACVENPEVSTITSVEDFTLTLEGVPDLIVVSDEETTEITIPFTLSDEQIVTTRVGVEIDEDLTTATLGSDYTISSQLVEVAGYVNQGSFTVTVNGDILPDGDPELIVLNVGPSVASPTNPFQVSNSQTVTIQINNYTEDGVAIIADWGGAVGVPSLNGGSPEPVFGICENGTDLDPLVLQIEDGALNFFTYSDDYAACPEFFTGVETYPNDSFLMVCELFVNPFAPFPDAIGDLCLDMLVVKPGVSVFEFTQESCFGLNELGYAQAGGVYRLTPVTLIVKEPGIIYFYTVADETLIGTVERMMSSTPQLGNWNRNKLNTYVPVEDQILIRN
jgi:hypothetical protein